MHSIALFKDPDNHFVHRIRNIHIYEADYNLLLKLKWEQAIKISEQQEILHRSQHGSRKARRSIDPIIIKIMQQEVSRQANLPFIQINYDAQACYDRIIPDIAFTISRKHGVHPSILNIVRETMQQAKYYIKLGPQVTNKFYHQTNKDPIFGTGQGSGCSPHIWTMLSSKLLHLYTEESNGFQANNPFGSYKDHLHATAYVDDVNTHHSFSNQESFEEMSQRVQQEAQRWSDLLYISGGKLSQTKCNYYAVQWKYATTGRTKVLPSNYPSLDIDDREGKNINITNINTTQHHKLLGYLHSMSNPIEYQKRVLQKTYDHLLGTLLSTNMDFQEIRTYYQTIHSPKIQYISQMSLIPRKVLSHITRQGTTVTLQLMGFSSKTPHGIVYGHKAYGGLEMIDVHILQGAQNLINFSRGLASCHSTHNIMKIAYHWWRFKDGRSRCPIQKYTQSNTTIESIWFTELQQFIQTHKITIKMDNTMYPIL